MDNISGVYKIESKTVLNKRYIGSTSSLRQRWQIHLNNLRKNKHHSVKLQRHYNKYGEDDLFFSVIKCCPQEELASTEQYFMDCYNPFFNSIKTANMYWGYEHSEETKIRMSKIRTEYNNRPDIAERKRKRMKELWSDDNYREKVIKARLGNKQSQETVNKRIATRLANGRPWMPKKKISEKPREKTEVKLPRICEHCGKICNFTDYNFHHGGRCKEKPLLNYEECWIGQIKT